MQLLSCGTGRHNSDDRSPAEALANTLDAEMNGESSTFSLCRIGIWANGGSKAAFLCTSLKKCRK